METKRQTERRVVALCCNASEGHYTGLVKISEEEYRARVQAMANESAETFTAHIRLGPYEEPERVWACHAIPGHKACLHEYNFKEEWEQLWREE